VLADLALLPPLEDFRAAAGFPAAPLALAVDPAFLPLDPAGLAVDPAGLRAGAAAGAPAPGAPPGDEAGVSLSESVPSRSSIAESR
jgi:hypothetical protein